MLARLGHLCIFLVLFVLAFLVVMYAPTCEKLKDHTLAGMRLAAADLGVAGGVAMAFGEEKKDEELSQSEIETRTRRRKLRSSVLRKLKVIVAAWQIASSTQTVLFQVRFPPIFAKVTRVFDVLGLAIFDVGSFKCVFGWSYFQRLLFVTLAPFAMVILVAGPYWLIQRRRGLDPRKIVSTIKYWALFFIYIILPSISTDVVTYFSRAQCRNQV